MLVSTFEHGQSRAVALVTGASRGLGRAIALELAARNYHVILNYKREHNEAQQTLQAILQTGVTAELCQADITKPEELHRMFAGIPRLDVLVNNAGITRDELLITMRQESWQQVMATNLSAVFHCSQMAAKLMCAAGKGTIVNIGSSSSASARVGQTNYSAAKSGLIGLTRAMAAELITYGVRVVTVAPGFTASDMAHAVSDDVQSSSLQRIPLARWGRPEEIAATVAFLVSDAAAAITGQTWMVDGGRTAFEAEYAL
jgi:3-oxoacyl-[acyl-carrier protein] reductase